MGTSKVMEGHTHFIYSSPASDLTRPPQECTTVPRRLLLASGVPRAGVETVCESRKAGAGLGLEESPGRGLASGGEAWLGE